MSSDDLYSKMKNGMEQLEMSTSRKIKVALLIDEFFGGAGTAFGGYGFLARRFIAKYIPNENIELDVLLGRGTSNFWAKKYKEDNVNLYRLPKRKFFAQRWLKKQNYDVYLSIELTTDYVLKNELDQTKKLILWIQDPRPKSAWETVINTMTSISDPCFYNQSVYDTVHDLAQSGRVTFISQGRSLNPLAIDLYRLQDAPPHIQYLPNPVELDINFEFDIKNKKKKIVFWED